MEGENTCEGLLEKAFGEVLADKTLRKQLWKCLNSEVFGIDGLRFSCDESHTMSIKLPEQFFDKPDFLWSGKLSDTKLSKFYETLKTLQKQFEHDLIVDSYAIPSSTRLQLELKFPLTKFLRDKELQINDITIGVMLQHLKDLWKKLIRKLKFDYKWDVF